MPDGTRVAFHMNAPEGVRSVDCQPQSLAVFSEISECRDTPHDVKKWVWDAQIEVLVAEIFQVRLDEGECGSAVLCFVRVASITTMRPNQGFQGWEQAWTDRQLTDIHCMGSIPWVAYEQPHCPSLPYTPRGARE